MTMQPSPDLLDLAEAVAAGTLRADDAERQLRLALGSDRAAESEQAVRELRGLIGAAGAVRAHARATREAFGPASTDLAATVAPTPASIATLVPGRVTAGAVHRRSSNGGDSAGRAPRRMWLLAAAALLLVGGAMAAGSGLVKLPSVVPPTPVPTAPVAVVNPTAMPTPAPSETPAIVAPGPGPGQFAYVKELKAYGANDQIWVANADGTGPRPLIPPQGGKIGLGNWSADGTRLVFSVAPAHTTPSYPTFGPSRLYLIDATGSGPQPVDTGCVETCSEGDAALSNDGSRLVFVRGDRLATVDLSAGLVTELPSTAPAAGEYYTGAPGDSHPRWSPDGTQIVFAQELPRTSQSGDCPTCTVEPVGVFVVDADGQNLRQVGATCSLACAPDWSPDGTRIVFGAVSGDNTHQYFDIDTVRPDGTDLRRLTSDRISVLPSWTADGRIAFVKTPMVDGNLDTMHPAQWWTMDADGGNAAQYIVSALVQELWAGNVTHPVWQPTP
jgi:dipeptidyl aminopeptidase/acylaminoacyl peptidase